jgi:outer membrane protein insertion porin family
MCSSGSSSVENEGGLLSFKHHKAVTVMLLICFLSSADLRAQETGKESPATPVKQVAGVTLDIHDYPGPQDRFLSLASDLISLKPGQTFSQDRLESSLSLLRLSGRFEEVKGETMEKPEGVEVVLHLKPYLQIRNIKLSGVYPIFEQDILNVMTVYVGNYVQPGMAEAQEALIEQFLKDEGFLDPKVSVGVLDDRKDGTVVLEVDLRNGPSYRLKELKITGNRRFSETRLKLRMDIWKRSFFLGSSGRFIEKSLVKDAKDLASFYWSNGYADAGVTYSFQKNRNTGNVRVTVSIKEGPLYKVSYTGRKHFYKFTLNKELSLFKDGNRSGSGVRKSVRNIRDLYLSSGFPKVKVKASEEAVEKDGREVRRVRVAIDEGSRAVVEGVSFTGNTAIKSSRLAESVETGKRIYPVLGKMLFSKDVLTQDIQTIQTLFTDRGYLAAEVGADLTWSPDGKSVSVVFRVIEGVQTLVSTIGFEGITSITPGQALSCITLKEGSPFNRTALKNDESALATCISERGYPHVEVKASAVMSADGKGAQVKFAVREGMLVSMGNTYFSGNFMTRKRILQHELDMEQGDPFSLSKMVKGQNAIRDMNIFNAVKFKTLGLREYQDKVTVLADLEEKKPYYVQTSVGYGSDVGVYGNARMGDHNLFGLNRDVWLGTEISQVSERYELGVNAPRLLGTRVAGVYTLFWERREDFNQNFGLKTFGYNLGLIKRFGRRVFTSLNFKYERRNEFIVDDELQAQLDADKTPEELADEAETLKPRSIFVVTPGITYDTRDSFMNPKRGNFSSGYVDISYGLQNSQDIDNFIRYRADVREYVSPAGRLTLAWMCKAGYIMANNPTDQIPDDQLFYLGGALSVRGYRENMLLYDENNNPVGGRLSLVSSLEARFRVLDGIEVPLFFDIGMIQNTNVTPVVPNTRASYGTGLRYLTPIGPISLVYGHKLRPEPGESPYELHFSLGYTF